MPNNPRQAARDAALLSSVAFQNDVDESCGERSARIGPLKGPGLGIVGVDERQQPLHQSVPEFEDPAANDLAGRMPKKISI